MTASVALPGRLLVAGIGNEFFGDDGFGPAVVRCLRPEALPANVDVADYGIRGLHLAYDLLERRHAGLVLVDALPMNEPPGTLSVVEVERAEEFAGGLDPHAMSPAVVLSAVAVLGGRLPPVAVVGCQPDRFDIGMCLSPPVEAALAEAAHLVEEVVRARADGLQRDDRAPLLRVGPDAAGEPGEPGEMAADA